ncbi:MAG: hypothetical protein [Bacteriophage sp.]|nr:MAG: hypothetical protein [Bacteriophage sp.]
MENIKFNLIKVNNQLKVELSWDDFQLLNSLLVKSEVLPVAPVVEKLEGTEVLPVKPIVEKLVQAKNDLKKKDFLDFKINEIKADSSLLISEQLIETKRLFVKQIKNFAKEKNIPVLKAWRSYKKITQVELAKLANITTNKISKMENLSDYGGYGSNVTNEDWKAIAKVFDCSTIDLR